MTEKDVHRGIFAYNMAHDVETPVRKWLTTRLDDVGGVDNMKGGAT